MNRPVRSWIVTVETVEGLTTSPEILERVAAALDAHATALGPAASLDTERRVISATFCVEAPTQGRAAELAIAAFYDALAAADFDVELPGWKLTLEIEPSAEPAIPA